MSDSDAEEFASLLKMKPVIGSVDINLKSLKEIS